MSTSSANPYKGVEWIWVITNTIKARHRIVCQRPRRALIRVWKESDTRGVLVKTLSPYKGGKSHTPGCVPGKTLNAYKDVKTSQTGTLF